MRDSPFFIPAEPAGWKVFPGWLSCQLAERKAFQGVRPFKLLYLLTGLVWGRKETWGKRQHYSFSGYDLRGREVGKAKDKDSPEHP